MKDPLNYTLEKDAPKLEVKKRKKFPIHMKELLKVWSGDPRIDGCQHASANILTRERAPKPVVHSDGGSERLRSYNMPK